MSVLLLGVSVAIGRALFVLVEDPIVKRWSRPHTRTLNLESPGSDGLGLEPNR